MKEAEKTEILSKLREERDRCSGVDYGYRGWY